MRRLPRRDLNPDQRGVLERRSMSEDRGALPDYKAGVAVVIHGKSAVIT